MLDIPRFDPLKNLGLNDRHFQNQQQYATNYNRSKDFRWLSFDGVDDYVNAGNNIDIPIISISAWINMSNYQGFRAVTKATDSTALGGVQWAFGTTALGLYYFQLYSAGRTTNNLVATGGSAINEVNEWHLFSSVYNGDNGSTIKLYLDNNPLSMTYTPAGTGFSSFSGNSNINIGVLFKNNAPIYAKGSIDEVRIYNRALSESEILALYERRYPDVSPSGLVLLHDYKTGTAKDLSGNGNDGTVFGAIFE